MSNPIEEHINLYQRFAPNPTAFRESLEKAIIYAKELATKPNANLRDDFAAHAPIDFTDLDCIFGSHWDEFSGKELITKLAIARYDYADAMMKAREQ